MNFLLGFFVLDTWHISFLDAFRSYTFRIRNLRTWVYLHSSKFLTGILRLKDILLPKTLYPDPNSVSELLEPEVHFLSGNFIFASFESGTFRIREIHNWSMYASILKISYISFLDSFLNISYLKFRSRSINLSEHTSFLDMNISYSFILPVSFVFNKFSSWYVAFL